jgi:hypothetical protein
VPRFGGSVAQLAHRRIGASALAEWQEQLRQATVIVALGRCAGGVAFTT